MRRVGQMQRTAIPDGIIDFNVTWLDIVYRAIDLDSTTDPKRQVAIKRIKLTTNRADQRDGINRTALREIKLLRELHHENVCDLLDVFSKGVQSVSLVFELCPLDLSKIIGDLDVIFTVSDVKCFVLQTFIGCDYLHQNWVLHRDLRDNLKSLNVPFRHN